MDFVVSAAFALSLFAGVCVFVPVLLNITGWLVEVAIYAASCSVALWRSRRRSS